MAKISAWVVWNSDENESDWRAAATEDEAWQNANDLGAHRVGLSWVPDTRGGIAKMISKGWQSSRVILAAKNATVLPVAGLGVKASENPRVMSEENQARLKRHAEGRY